MPGTVDDAVAAAIVNPALSSWIPLVCSAHLAPGETVLILEATGTAGLIRSVLHSPASRRPGNATTCTAAESSSFPNPLSRPLPVLSQAIPIASEKGMVSGIAVQ
jgi:hypothetical protein